MTFVDWIALSLAFFVFLYLLAALLRPELFD